MIKKGRFKNILHLVTKNFYRACPGFLNLEGSNPPSRLNELDWSVYTCLTQPYGGREMYHLLHKEQLHVSTIFIGHLQVDRGRNM